MEANKYSIWFVVIVGVFVTALITANIIAAKVATIFGLIVDAGIVIFPISYIAGDVLTEVYGYHTARRVIWLGFFCNLIAVLGIVAGQHLPAVSFWDGQAAYERILGYSPRLLVASFLAYLVGEHVNAYVMARMRRLTQGRWLWSRTIGSTLVGQGVDSLIFLTVAFIGTMTAGDLGATIVTQWLFKTSYEALATPLTYAAIHFFQRQEHPTTGMEAIRSRVPVS